MIVNIYPQIRKGKYMNTIDVSIKGTAPLLFHRFAEGIGGKPDPNITDREIAEQYLYVNESKKIYTPNDHIERSLQKAGTQFKFKGRKTYLDFIKSGVFITPDAIVHKNQEWVPDKRAVVIKGARIMRVRPRMDNWELDFTMEIINAELDFKVLNDILVYAGQYIGIGDYRPKFGRFLVSKFEYDQVTRK